MCADPPDSNVSRVWATFAPMAGLTSTTAVAPVTPGNLLFTWLAGVRSAWRAPTCARVWPKSSGMGGGGEGVSGLGWPDKVTVRGSGCNPPLSINGAAPHDRPGDPDLRPAPVVGPLAVPVEQLGVGERVPGARVDEGHVGVESHRKAPLG